MGLVGKCSVAHAQSLTRPLAHILTAVRYDRMCSGAVMQAGRQVPKCVRREIGIFDVDGCLLLLVQILAGSQCGVL